MFEVHSSHAVDPLLRFYVSDLTMLTTDGGAVPVRLDESPWQNDRTALVALGGPARNPVVSGRVATGRFEAIEFLLGIPHDRNHGDPLRAEPPLNVPSMFWTWQSGYKFLRLDIANDWSFHLGSTGCVSASAVRPPADPCRQPNAARIRLASAAPDTGTVVVDLEALLARVDIGADGNCIDSYAEREACRSLLTALGLEAGTGRCIADCDGQRVFRLTRATGVGVGSP